MRMASEAAASGLKQCRQAQNQLEEAISVVMKAEQQLRENAREVRGELQSCVSRQQEALRCREIWLLSQIELLEQVKAETLQQQLHQLHWLRGQFDAISHQLHSCHSSNDLNNQLTSCMEKLSSFSLTPEETPEMNFQADTRSLRQAITSFGSITAQGASAQGSDSHKGQSCPIAAKRQTAELGALSDWLLGSCPSSSGSIIYQTSKNPEDWLLSHAESKTSCPVLPSVDFLQAWGQLRDLQAWLFQDQTPVSRERSSSSCSSSFSIEKIDESEFTPEEEEEEEEVELSDWLVTPPHITMETVSDAERWRQVLKPFEDTWSPNEWLVESNQPVAGCSSCCQTSRAMEIENLGQLKCLKTPVTPPEASMMALDAWLQQAAPVPQTCRANELCSTYADCICEDNCGKEVLSAWLLQQDGRDKNGVPVASSTPSIITNAPPFTKPAAPTPYHREQEQKVQAILEAWLHPTKTGASSKAPVQTLSPSLSAWVAPGEEKASREEHSSNMKPSASPLFQCPLDPERWVLPGKTPSPAPGLEGHPSPAEKEDKWLLRKRSQAQVLPSVCDLFSCMKVGGDKEKWLHKAPVQM